MNKGITIHDFLKTKEITPEDLKKNFQFVKRIDVDMIHNKGCPNCNNKSNYYNYPSPAWTQVNECIACKTIMVTYITDRMGGGGIDTVDVYEQKSILNTSCEPKKRYFIVFLTGERNIGIALHIETEGNYITFPEIREASQHQWKGSTLPILFPTNIIELNESDYKDWVK